MKEYQTPPAGLHAPSREMLDAFEREALSRPITDPFYHDAAKLMRWCRALQQTCEELRKETAELKKYDCRTIAQGQSVISGVNLSGSAKGYSGPSLLSSAPLSPQEIEVGQAIAKKYGFEEASLEEVQKERDQLKVRQHQSDLNYEALEKQNTILQAQVTALKEERQRDAVDGQCALDELNRQLAAYKSLLVLCEDQMTGSESYHHAIIALIGEPTSADLDNARKIVEGL